MSRGGVLRRLLLALCVLAVIAAAVARRAAPDAAPAARVLAPAASAEGFARAGSADKIAFPGDYGPHPDYQTEWWYYTGNVQTADGRRFGYQLTFFRRALAPAGERLERASSWAADQVYMAHFALTDVGGRRFHAFERFARGAAGLAGAQASPYRVWLENWSVEETAPATRRLRAEQDGLALDLLLVDTRGPVLQGFDGYSQKGADPGNASHYYSLTRLATSGQVSVGGEVYQVAGQSWMDHEWSTSALGADQVGWDWLALQLDDGSDIMLFTIRKADGSIDPFSSGNFVAADGTVTRLTRDDFTLTSMATWRSPRSGATYPARWQIAIPALDVSLTVEPLLADQELNLSFTYWEGAVSIDGRHAGQPVTGSGYIELTGYAHTMQGQF